MKYFTLLNRDQIVSTGMALAVTMLLLGIIGLSWPKPVVEMRVPIGRVISADNGLSNRSFTNRTIVVWRPKSPVLISNVSVTATHDGFWFMCDERACITIKDCSVSACNTGYYFGEIK